MKLIEGWLDYKEPWELPVVKLFTGNGVVTGGQLVMGAGAALAVEDNYPETAYAFGKLIEAYPDMNLHFHKLNPEDTTEQLIGWFKVKEKWWDAADLEIIQKSVQELSELANEPYNYTFHMNYPGIGFGKLTEEQVSPIIEALPDNVFLYR